MFRLLWMCVVVLVVKLMLGLCVRVRIGRWLLCLILWNSGSVKLLGMLKILCVLWVSSVLMRCWVRLVVMFDVRGCCGCVSVKVVWLCLGCFLGWGCIWCCFLWWGYFWRIVGWCFFCFWVGVIMCWCVCVVVVVLCCCYWLCGICGCLGLVGLWC